MCTHEDDVGLEIDRQLNDLRRRIYDAVFWLLLLVTVITTCVSVGISVWRRLHVAPSAIGEEVEEEEGSPGAVSYRASFVALGALALTLALGRVLATYHLMYSRFGAAYGAGWTDVHVRLPANYVTAALLAIAGVLLLVPRSSRALERWASTRFPSPERAAIAAAAAPVGAAAAIGVLGLLILPPIFQWLVVHPNELTLEERYIKHNIEFTRRGFALNDLRVEEFPMEGTITPEVVSDNERLLSEVRLWDPLALEQVLQQSQAIRLYYAIRNIDIDRYTLDGRYRQVMVAPREMETKNLPSESQTFVNRHIKYTHGYGVAMAPVSDFTSEGFPRLVLRDLPPVAEYPTLQLDRPEIYFGERTNDFVIGNSRAPEFDYPAGASNVYSHYQGTGGVPLESFWRKLVFGWKVGGTKLLFSNYPTSESRILFRRNVSERVARVAPFLDLDDDPYTVVVGGRLKWIVDAYATSRYFPYSEPYSTGSALPKKERARGAEEPADAASSRGAEAPEHRRLQGANYVRNSVKAVVDAYDGTVTLYVFAPDDPIVQVWSRIYPDLFRPATEMDAELRAHVRYPEAMLHAQGIIFAKYHMTDPLVFYNKEDLWIRATEKYYDEVRPVEPYYVMWQPPGSREVEFILMQPYTPKARQVLIGWIAAMCDGDNYGRLVAYRFPKDKWVPGPQQVDTKIDQDPDLSAQLTLWNQHGKRVIRGNVLAIPIDRTLLYVEPIYIQAQTAAYPELSTVVLMHGDRMSYALTFETALENLVAGRPGAPAGEARAPRAADAARRASRIFEEYIELTTKGRLAEAGARLEALREALREVDDGSALPSR